MNEMDLLLGVVDQSGVDGDLLSNTNLGKVVDELPQCEASGLSWGKIFLGHADLLKEPGDGPGEEGDVPADIHVAHDVQVFGGDGFTVIPWESLYIFQFDVLGHRG